ncbi:tripartite tricarboxylate transporter substrate-binding protein [Psychrobacillus sp. NPDC093180]|uniref:tripartite tricarboxylate transporter substrate binding protein n=1 Tax=Psychrobacillus sp. NPDC093180 TaxID=3364489 RepID=UPI003814628B
MKKIFTLILLSMLLVMLAACGNEPENTSAEAETPSSDSNYPEKALTFIVPSGAGGGLDTMGRTLSSLLSTEKLVDKAITVENNPGGGQVVGTVAFANKEKGNDYKMLIASTPFLLNHIKKEGNSPISYRDITPIARLVTEYDVLAVPADSPYQDLQSLMTALKADPQSITFSGGSGPGSFDHLNAIYPAMKSGVDIKSMKYISYDGGGEALTALLGGNADVVTSDVSSVYEFVKSGDVRILGISAPERLEGAFAEIPTYKEQGIDAVLTNWRGLYGPADMSDDAKAFWSETIANLSETQGWADLMEKQGWQDGFMPEAEFIKLMEEEEAMYTAIYEDLGMAK